MTTRQESARTGGGHKRFPHGRGKRKADPRPTLQSAGLRPRSRAEGASLAMAFALLSLALGLLVGSAVFLVMNLSEWLTRLIWESLGSRLSIPLFPLITCTLGGAVIGVWTYVSNDRVKSLEEVLGEFKRTGSYKTQGAIRPVVTFLLPLAFGGSIGFEAGLTGLITAGCCWVRDRIKRAGLSVARLHVDEVADASIAACVSAIFATPLAGIVAGVEDASKPNASDYTMRRGAKVALYTAAAFGAFGGILLFTRIFGSSSGLPRFDSIAVGDIRLLWVIPCIVAAYAMTLLHHASRRFFASAARRLGTGAVGTVAAPVAAGALMGAVATFLPYVLFPGEAQTAELMREWSGCPAIVLLATGFAKAAITPMCLSMGWMGGDFFPSIFSGVAAGYGLAALTGADPMLMVTVTTTAFLAGVTRKPLLTLAILILCFPANGLIWMGVAAVIGAAMPLPSFSSLDGAADAPSIASDEGV